MSRDGLYVVLISVHGLIRGHNLELGRDADTGGQTRYVVELARALAAHPAIARVDLLTRRVIDAKVSPDYAEPEEILCPGARIVRLACGPRRYLRKEVLWPYLDNFTDAALQHVRRVGRVPDWVHSHYADAGYVGARLSALLGVPLIHTGHSLGRVKRRRLLDHGQKEQAIESHYNMSQRIEAEELALDSAARVVASTSQEVAEQYSLYDNYQPKRMVVIPPGTDIDRFRPPARHEPDPPIYGELQRFLREPRKPMILAVSRADPRKNIATLLSAYGESPELRARANLVLVAGNRDDISALERGPREVLTGVLSMIDRYDLYGHVAYPKQHRPEDVPDLYRLAAKTRGVFVNPALTEPFGLTLIEAAASGLPVVATCDGGPREILRHCRHGLLVDPLDRRAMTHALLDALSSRERWQRWSRYGQRGALTHYSWSGHVQRYVQMVQRLLEKRKAAETSALSEGVVSQRPGKGKIQWFTNPPGPWIPSRSRMPMVDRFVLCDIDNTLIGEREGLAALLERLRAADVRVGFGVATGRRLKSALEAIEEWGVPMPDVLITGVGAEIHYGNSLMEDSGWQRHIDYRWRPDALREAMARLPGLRLQPREEQRRHKLSYFLDPARAPSVRDIQRHLRRLDLHANVIYSHGAYLDLLPLRASKGLAMRYVGGKWGLPPERFLVAGDSGNDGEMLCGNTLGVVVGNYSSELERLRGRPRIYFAQGHCAWGVLEGIEHYDFLGAIRVPEDERPEDS
ncbi:MAG: HAD-IIB family hydrolase [Thiohalomonadaceae bacterium]